MGGRLLLSFRTILLAVTVALAVAASLWPATARAGYTHYWTWHGTPVKAELRLAVADCRLLAQARAELLDGVDNADPLSISLNGRGDLAHEDFIFPGRESFEFCKTAGKPYDEVVTACLLAARDHFPPATLEIASDGSFADWAAGRELYEQTFGHAAENPLAGGGRAGGGMRLPGVGGLGYRSLLLALVVLVAFFAFVRGGSGGAAGWGSYTLIWLVAPTLIAVISANPIVLVVVVVGLVARRWLPDPYLILKYAARIRALDASVRANPANLTARRDLAVIWLAKRRPGKALPLLEQALERDPQSTELRFLLGQCLLGTRAWDRAVTAFIAVLDAEPRFRYGEAYLRAADGLLALQRWPDAMEGLAEYVKINRSSVEAQVKLARARRENGDGAGALAALDEAKNVYRDLPGFQRRHQLGWYLRAVVRRWRG